MKHFDAIIIGTGQAGPPLAAGFAGAGKTVAIIERHKFGGTCVNTGCTPTKTASRIEPNRVMDLLRSQPSQRTSPVAAPCNFTSTFSSSSSVS